MFSMVISVFSEVISVDFGESCYPSNMGSSDLEFRLETRPIRGLADPELAYSSSLGLYPNWV